MIPGFSVMIQYIPSIRKDFILTKEGRIYEKTKIVCTVGPATDNDDILREMMLSGMNVARFNFSHGDYAVHEKDIISCAA